MLGLELSCPPRRQRATSSHAGGLSSPVARRRRAAPSIIGVALVLSVGGCRGEIVTIGEKPAPTYHFTNCDLIVELATYARTNNPTLTEDLLEIFFTSTRDQGNFDIWTASRATRHDRFAPPQKVRAVSSGRFDTGSAVSPDGLTLWLGSDRRSMGSSSTGGLDIWVSTRATRTADWSEPVLVPSLNSQSFDIPRPPGLHGLVMPLGSERGPGSVYRTFFASRASRTAPFETPQTVPELMFENATTMDAFLSQDGLTLFYASGPITMANEGGAPLGLDAGAEGSMADVTTPVLTADLFVARREKVTDPFSGFTQITDLNTLFDERDPWLSEDKTRFFFSSDRGGNLNIYTCDVIFK
jgi:WD40-like Beta Propeller Repeat